MPNQPRTPNRSVRVPDELWHTAQWIARDRGLTMTQVVNTLLERWVRANHPLEPRGDD